MWLKKNKKKLDINFTSMSMTEVQTEELTVVERERDTA